MPRQSSHARSLKKQYTLKKKKKKNISRSQEMFTVKKKNNNRTQETTQQSFTTMRNQPNLMKRNGVFELPTHEFKGEQKVG